MAYSSKGIEENGWDKYLQAHPKEYAQRKAQFLNFSNPNPNSNSRPFHSSQDRGISYKPSVLHAPRKRDISTLLSDD